MMNKVLIVMENPNSNFNDCWYIDLGCSNHMTRHREWLVNFNDNKKSIIRFADNMVIQAKGTSNVMVRRTYGSEVVISDVLYVPKMKSNLIGMGQLLERGFSMKIIDNSLETYDSRKKLAITVPLTSNRTFKVNLNTIKTQCFSAAVLDES